MKKYSMGKIVAAVMLFVMILIATVGCGSDNKQSDKNEGGSGTNVTSTGTSGNDLAEKNSTDNSASIGENVGTANTEVKEAGTTGTEISEEYYGFKVDGTKLLDANGNEFVMRGINHAHCWYKDYDITAFDAIATTGSNCIRIVCANGIQWTKDSAASVSQLIEMARERNMIAIVEVHDGTGSDDVDTLVAIAEYWISIKDVFEGTESYCILNIANEWLGSWSDKKWKEGYTKVIPMLREAGIKNTIMVDAGGWGQYGDSIIKAGTAVFESDPDANTMFSIHMYGTAGKNAKTIEKNIKSVTDKNLCICVGEFGYTHSDGDVDEAFIMKYCTENNVGYIAWSWKGNSGGVEYLDLATKWDGSVLSADWGENVVNGEYGIKATSKLCSIFK